MKPVLIFLAGLVLSSCQTLPTANRTQDLTVSKRYSAPPLPAGSINERWGLERERPNTLIAIILWCKTHPNGGTLHLKNGETVFIDRNERTKRLRDAQMELWGEIPE